jgi:hypothetical protein
MKSGRGSRARRTTIAGLTILVSSLTGCSAGSATSTTVTVVSTTISTATITASATSAGTSTSATTTPNSSPPAVPAGNYLAGDLTVQFPAGEAGVISVVAQGPREKTSAGTQWPIVVRNNTQATVCDIRATVAATSGGKIIGSANLDSITPAITEAGAFAYGHLYFDTNLPDDSTVEFTFTHKDVQGCYAVPAIIDEVNLVPGTSGNNLVGKIRAPADQKIGGPISIDILCMDDTGQLLSGGGNDGFADQDKLAQAQPGTFSVDLRSGPCDKYLVGASGYAF